MPTPTFTGTTFQLNPNNTGDEQFAPAVAALEDGRFAAVYRSDDAKDGNLRLVIYNADGTIAKKETIVDPDHDGRISEDMVNITSLKGGGFAVTWQQEDAGGENIYHRVYGANGKPVTGVIQTNETLTEGLARRPDIVGDGDGGFYIVWDDNAFDRDPGAGVTLVPAVRMQHFGADGQPIGGPTMPSDTWGYDINPAIAISRNGEFVNVVWDDNLGQSENTSNTDGIYGTETGTRGDYRVDDGQFSEFHGDPDIAYSTGGTFMAVWSEFVEPGKYAVHGSIGDGPEFQINTSTHAHAVTMPKVVGLSDGNFLVVWYDGGQDGSDDVLGQLINNQGEKIGTEFEISDGEHSDISRISASEMADGRVVVTWAARGGSSEIYARMVDPRQGAVNLVGTDADEQFVGTEFADTITGGAGADMLAGGAGADGFIFASATDTGVKKADRDHLVDFSEEDVIDLSQIDANGSKKGDPDFKFIGNDDFNKKAGELRFEIEKGDTVVSADINGNGKADFSFVIEGEMTLKDVDFLL